MATAFVNGASQKDITNQKKEENKMANVIVLFEVTVKDGKMDDYLRMATSLKENLGNAKGFIRSERFSSLATDGKLLSMSIWENEESVTEWRNLAAHRTAQDIYFSGKAPDFTPPLKMDTTPFRKAVWEIMLTIPFGQTMTYGEIADRIAKQRGLAKMSAQAVGGAVGHNSISLIIPCHRVVGTNGSLTGYAGGIEKKVQLLTMEKTDMSAFFVPKKGTAL